MPDLPSRLTIDISTGTIVKIILAVLALVFLSLVSNIIVLLFISFILAASIDPFIDWFQKRHIHRGVGVVVVYLGAFAILSLVIGFLIPPVVTEVSQLLVDLPQRYQTISSFLSDVKTFGAQEGIVPNVDQIFGSLGDQASKLGGNIFNVARGVFGGFFSVFLILILTFYLSIAEDALKHLIRLLSPSKHEDRIIRLVERIQHKMGLWLRGQLILSFSIFLITLIGLSVLHVKYAWALAFLAGIMELVPFVGPTIAAIPAVLTGFTQSPTTGVLVLIMYILVQQVENHLLVPNIMKRTVGLHQIVVILAVLIGVKLLGIAGALLAVPLAATLILIVQEFAGEGEHKNGLLHSLGKREQDTK